MAVPTERNAILIQILHRFKAHTLQRHAIFKHGPQLYSLPNFPNKILYALPLSIAHDIL